MDQLNFVQVTLEARQTQDQAGTQEPMRSSELADQISAVVENRYSGSGKGSILLRRDRESLEVQETFEELTSRIPNRLQLKQVAPAGRETLRLSINPEHILRFANTRNDGRGTIEGSRVELKNGENFFVVESYNEVNERLAVIAEQRRSQRPSSY